MYFNLSQGHLFEQNFQIFSFYSENDWLGSMHWLGGTDAVVQGTFRWTNGRVLQYERWAANEPNDAGVSDIT